MKSRRTFLPIAMISIITMGYALPSQTGVWTSHIVAAEIGNETAISINSISTRYDAEFETFHVFGEVVNNLGSPVQNVKLNITFYDSNGNLTGTIYDAPYFSDLRPGEKSSFDLVAQGSVASELVNFSYYKISRTFEIATESKEPLLRLEVRKISIDPCGYYRIEGLVANLAKEQTSGIRISAAFYNEQNQIVATASTGINGTLDPTKSDQFAFIVERKSLSHFAYYSFDVQSDRYTSAIIEGDENLSNFHSLTPSEGKIMTVSTELPVYNTGEDKLTVMGQVPVEEVKIRGENSLVLIKIVTASGSTQVLRTAPVASNGTFAKEIEFQMDEPMRGEAFRIRAEYFGMIAENTFSVGHGSLSPEQEHYCEGFKSVDISELKALADGSSTGKVSDYLSGREIKLGSNVTLLALLGNELSMTQNVTVIYEVFDSQGQVVYLNIAERKLGPNGMQALPVLWLPEQEGTFVIKTFLLSSLYQPVLLSTGTPLSIKIIE